MSHSHQHPHHHLPDPLLDALDKDSDDRTDADISLIYRYASEIPFFARGLRYSTFSKAVLRDICKALCVEDYDPQEIVFRQGEVGDKLYIIYSGETHVLVDQHETDGIHRASIVQAGRDSTTTDAGRDSTTTDDTNDANDDTNDANDDTNVTNVTNDNDTNDNNDNNNDNDNTTSLTTDDEDPNDAEVSLTMQNPNQTPPTHQTQLMKDIQADKQRNELMLLRKHENLDIEEHVIGCIGMIRIATIQQQGSFGDLALLNDTPRSAYVVTGKNDTILLTLSKDNYERCIADYEKKHMKRRYNIISNVPAFHHWPKSDLEAICMLLTEQRLSASEVLYKQGDPGTNLWIVKSGELRGVKKVKASELGVNLVDVNIQNTSSKYVKSPKIHKGGWVFLNVGTYSQHSILGEMALVPRMSQEKESTKKDETDVDYDSGDEIMYHSQSLKNNTMAARNARGSAAMQSWHNKEYWEEHARTHRQPSSIVATTACVLYVISKQVFGRRIQQFADSLRHGVDNAATHSESLISHSETTDWKLYKAAVLMDVLKTQKRDRAIRSGNESFILNYEPVLDHRYQASNGNGLRETRFLADEPDDMCKFLTARKIRRDYIKQKELDKKHAHLVFKPTKRKGDADTSSSDDENKDEENENDPILEALHVPVSPLRKRKLHVKDRDQTKGKGKQKPPQKIIKGARKPRHVPTSTFYNLKRWMSRPPMELELRRILQPKERKTMDAGRKKRLGEILGSQIHEGLMGFGNDQALAVLDRHAEHRDDTLRSSLRLKTVKQMMQILGEHEEEEEDERRN